MSGGDDRRGRSGQAGFVAHDPDAAPAGPRSPTVVALLPKFMAHRERDIAAVREAIIRLDFAAIATVGHNLRGNAASYGFPQMSVLGASLEAAANGRNLRRVDEVLEELEACVQRIQVDMSESGDVVRQPASRTRLRAHAIVRDPEPRPLVLVVDDCEDNRALYAECLGHAGYGVMEAENGLEAVEKAREARPDIVVMDLSLPVLDGWEATRRLKEDPSTREILVVMLTGYALAAHVQLAKEAGFDGFLAKPCLSKDLLDKVQSMLLERVPPPRANPRPKSLR